jgi:hypothetical protein
MTHDLIRTLLMGLDAGVRKVVVSELKDDTFYAVIWLERGGELISIDSRPSDALAIALRLDCPIYVDDSVLSSSKAARTRSSSDRTIATWLAGQNVETMIWGDMLLEHARWKALGVGAAERPGVPRVEVAQVVPATASPLRHRVGLALPALRQIHPILRARQRRFAGGGGFVIGQLGRQHVVQPRDGIRRAGVIRALPRTIRKVSPRYGKFAVVTVVPATTWPGARSAKKRMLESASRKAPARPWRTARLARRFCGWRRLVWLNSRPGTTGWWTLTRTLWLATDRP